jgi:acyl-CoA thioesterase
VTIEEVLGIDGDAVVPGAGWGNQWGAIFGGYVAGVVMHALERAVPPQQSLSAVNVAFLRPLLTHAARLSAETHRRGRTATALGARLEQDGEPVAVATAWASADDEQPVRVDVVRPDVRPPHAYEPRPWRDDVVPRASRTASRTRSCRSTSTSTSSTARADRGCSACSTTSRSTADG